MVFPTRCNVTAITCCHILGHLSMINMWKQTCLVLVLAIGFVGCLNSLSGVQRVPKRDLAADEAVAADGVSYAYTNQWCHCCNYSESNSGCNKIRLGCFSRYPLCITTIHAPTCEKVVITKSCASPAYCEQQERVNPPECADGLVPVGVTCDYCCAGPGCNQYPQLPQTYSSSPNCPTDPNSKIIQKTADGKTVGTIPNLPNCGVNKYGNTQHTTGGDAEKGFYPWTVKIHEKLSVVNGMCAGTIIDEQWIITSASCVKNTDPESYTVVAGEYSLFLPDTTEKSLVLERIYKHPKYNSNQNGNNNVALLKLKYPIQFGETIQPICLPSSVDDFSGTKCTQSGWSITGFTQSKNVMKEGSLNVLDQQQCSTRRQDVSQNTICGTEHGQFSGLCGWDNGSPLQCKKGNKYVLAGVTAKGPEFPACGQGQHDRTKPVVFTNVARMMQWIVDTQIQDALAQN